MPSDGVLPAPVHKAKGGAGNGRERANLCSVWPVCTRPGAAFFLLVRDGGTWR